MLTSGDVIDLDLGKPAGREAGSRQPVVVVTAQGILDETANVIQVVPLTSAVRGFGSEVAIEPDEVNGLDSASSAQCQHIRSVSVDRIAQVRGNIGTTSLTQIRGVLSLILDILADDVYRAISTTGPGAAPPLFLFGRFLRSYGDHSEPALQGGYRRSQRPGYGYQPEPYR